MKTFLPSAGFFAGLAEKKIVLNPSGNNVLEYPAKLTALAGEICLEDIHV